MHTKIKVYGADWCSDCIKIKNFLKSKNLFFEDIDITKDDNAQMFVEQVNHGKRIIPTVLVNGETHINPSISQLIKLIT